MTLKQRITRIDVSQLAMEVIVAMCTIAVIAACMVEVG